MENIVYQLFLSYVVQMS